MKKIKTVFILPILLACLTFTLSPAQEAGGGQQAGNPSDTTQTDTTAKSEPDSLKASPYDTLKAQNDTTAQQQDDTTKTVVPAPATGGTSSAAADTSRKRTVPDSAEIVPLGAALTDSKISEPVVTEQTPLLEQPQAEQKSVVSSLPQPEEKVQTDSLPVPETPEEAGPAESALPQSRRNEFGAIPAWIFWVIGLLAAGVISTVVFLRRSRFHADIPRESLKETIHPALPPLKPEPVKQPAPVEPQPAKVIKTAKGKLLLSHAQHSGSRREQQDALVFSEPETASTHRGFLMVLADGMSGHACGKEAAEIAANAFLQTYQTKSPQEPLPAALERALKAANDAVIALAKERREENNVGSTLAAAVIENQFLHWISVGDTRIYILRMGQLTQLTVDHIYLNKLLEEAAAGKMEKAEAKKHPDRDALYSFLGLAELRETSRNKEPYPLQTGDRLLLCSEGLHKALSKNEIRETLGGSSAAPGELLVKKALDKKKSGQENITAIAVIPE